MPRFSRTLVVVAFVALLSLAGCNAVLDDGDSRTTDETGSVTPAPEPVSYPPGVTEQRLVEQSALVAAQEEALDGRAFRATLYINGTGPETGERQFHVHRVVTVADGGSPTQYFVSQSGPVGTHTDVVGWTNETHTFERVTDQRDGRVSYDVSTIGPGFSISPTQGEMERFITFGNFTTGAVQRRDDGTLIALEAVGTSDVGSQLREPRIDEYDGYLVVDDAGRIRTANLTVELRSSVRNTSLSIEYRLQLESQSVERPDWTAEAIAAEVDGDGGSTTDAREARDGNETVTDPDERPTNATVSTTAGE